MSPTARSLKLLRERGFTCQTVEKFNRFSNTRVDLFNFIDIVAISPSRGIFGVQSTSGSNFSARVAKVRAEVKSAIWLASGGRILVHGWSKKGPRGKRKTWECRELEITKQEAI